MNFNSEIRDIFLSIACIFNSIGLIIISFIFFLRKK